MYQVEYFLRVEKYAGLLVERSKPFADFQDAVDFIRSLKGAKEVIGTPLVSLVKD